LKIWIVQRKTSSRIDTQSLARAFQFDFSLFSNPIIVS
jgi:hypothetical protein